MKIIFCKICHKNVPYMGRHFKDNHNMSAKEYYDIHIKQLNEDICNYSNCYNKTHFDGIKRGYKQYCDKGCSRKGKPRNQQTKEKISISRNIWFNTDAGVQYKTKLSVDRQGLNNPVHKQTKETRVRMSLNNSFKMKQKILNNEFTPPVTNSWCKSRTVLDNIPFRSRWEAVFYILNKSSSLQYEKLRIPYTYNTVTRIYIVDFIDINNKIVYEIKPDSCLITEQNTAKLKALNDWANINNYTVQIIGNEYFKTNAKKINFNNYIPKIHSSMKQFL